MAVSKTERVCDMHTNEPCGGAASFQSIAEIGISRTGVGL